MTTLREWIANFKVEIGILHDVLKIMEVKGQNLTTAENLTVLSFDKIYISNTIELHLKEQKTA